MARMKEALMEIQDMGLDTNRPDVLEQYMRIKAEANAPKRQTLTPAEFVEVVAAELGERDAVALSIGETPADVSFTARVRDALELVAFEGS